MGGAVWKLYQNFTLNCLAADADKLLAPQTYNNNNNSFQQQIKFKTQSSL